MSDFGSKKPLFIQNPSISKSGYVNPSWESFRDHEIFKPQYREMENRPTTNPASMLRRNPDGTLDYNWAKNLLVDALHSAGDPHGLLPIHQALLTIIFPTKFRAMEPMQAAILTQLSTTEKDKLKELVSAHMLEEENFSGGSGGGSLRGRHVTRI